MRISTIRTRPKDKEKVRDFSDMEPFLAVIVYALSDFQDTNVGRLCKEMGITHQTLYRHVAPDGSLREDGEKLLVKKHK